MKKLFIAAVLIAALGGALYYFFEMRRPQRSSPLTAQQLIIGEWQVDSVALSKKDSSKSIAMLILALDTNFTKYSYAIKEDGNILIKLGDSTLPEKMNYRLMDSTSIVISDSGDSSSYEMKFAQKTNSHFTLIDKDSTLYFFKRKQ